jgi:3D-(3,5/4)-trihydroxycyclohexane-1,2-dione acylhydrolase (decyclizing)
VQRIYDIRLEPLPSQGELIGVINELSGPDAIMLNAAGSMPGDLHKLWRTTHPKNFHLEYGYSCMGYEIAGGWAPSWPRRSGRSRDRRRRQLADAVLGAGDGRAAGVKLIVLLWDNSGFKSIGSLSRSLGLDGFGTRFIKPEGRRAGGRLSGRCGGAAADRLRHERPQPGRHVIECITRDDYVAALKAAKEADRTTVVVIKNDRLHGVPGYESWWDVAVPEVSTLPSVQEARASMRRCGRRSGFFFEERLRMVESANGSWASASLAEVSPQGNHHVRKTAELTSTASGARPQPSAIWMSSTRPRPRCWRCAAVAARRGG